MPLLPVDNADYGAPLPFFQFLHEHDQQRIRQQQLEALLAATSFPVARLRQMLQHLVEELRIPATLVRVQPGRLPA